MEQVSLFPPYRANFMRTAGGNMFSKTTAPASERYHYNNHEEDTPSIAISSYLATGSVVPQHQSPHKKLQAPHPVWTSQ